MSKLQVLIVGASIAGPTAAYWFAKAGAKVTVIERFPKLRANGQNVDIRTAGVTVMRKMSGMEEAVRAKIVEMDGISFVREDGRPYGIIKATGNPDQQSLISEYEIYRGDLSQILFDMTAANENITYVFGEQVASLQQDGEKEGPVTVEFSNGVLPTTKYDLVVACDGATSRTRALGLGCGVEDHMHHMGSWVAYFTIQQDLASGSKLGKSYSVPGGRFVALGHGPSGGSKCVLMGIRPRGDDSITIPFREALKKGEDALKQYVAKYFEGVGWKTPEIIKGMVDSDDFYATEFLQVKTPNLYKGRFVMAGDAGYAPGPTGLGTTLALTGAYVLAGEVGKHKGDLAAGLRAYEERMKPIIRDMQQIPSLFPAVLGPQTAWGLWLRNHMFAFISWSGVMNLSQRLFANGFANRDRYKLPDYEWES